MIMDLALVAPWAAFALAIIALLGHAKNFFSGDAKQAAADLRALKGTVEEQGRRLQNVEGELRHLPDKDTITELKLAMAELKGTVSAMGVTVGAVSSTVTRIDDFLSRKA